MKRGLLTVSLLGAMAAGCQSGQPEPLAQLEYDLTVAEDRARFREQDLAYRGSVGPYAVYQVTGADPKLLGPSVRVDNMVGYAMLCGANHYFSGAKAGVQVEMRLLGGTEGKTTYVKTTQEARSDGDCTPPKDTFGNPLPPGDGGGDNPDGGGGDNPGGGDGCIDPGGCAGGGDGTTGTPSTGGQGEPVCTNPDGCPDGGSGSGGGGGTTTTGTAGTTEDPPVIQKLNIQFPTAPKPGSIVLLRRVALTGARQHNDSHLIPNICCTGPVCSLE